MSTDERRIERQDQPDETAANAGGREHEQGPEEREGEPQVPNTFTGDLASREPHEARQERLREKPGDIKRTALDGAPGIPAGSGTGFDRSLQTPDSELGGAIAGDTTPQGPTGDEPDEEQIRRDDRKRTTL